MREKHKKEGAGGREPNLRKEKGEEPGEGKERK